MAAKDMLLTFYIKLFKNTFLFEQSFLLNALRHYGIDSNLITSLYNNVLTNCSKRTRSINCKKRAKYYLVIYSKYLLNGKKVEILSLRLVTMFLNNIEN